MERISARFKGWWGRRLRHKLLISSITILIFSLALLGYVSFSLGQGMIRREVDERNLRLATLVAQEVQGQFDNISGNVRLLIPQLEDLDGSPRDPLFLQARAMLSLRRASPLTYRALYLLDNAGNVRLHLDDSLEALLKIEGVQEFILRSPINLTEPLAKAYEAAKSGQLYISPAFIIGADQVPISIMGIPFRTASGDLPQIVLAEIDLRDIWRSVDEIQVGRTGRAYVVSDNGLIIAHPDRAYIGQPLAAELAPVLTRFEGWTEYTDPLSGRTMLAAYSPVGGRSGWGIVVEQERREVFSQIYVVAFATLGVVLVALVLATVTTIFVSRTITNPLQRLARATQNIAHTGDLSHDIAVVGTDEVGRLAAAFNHMIVSLREAQKRLLATQAIAQELRIAQEIQASLLPTSAPYVPGLDISAKAIPAREVGGDFYDYYHLPSDGVYATPNFITVVGDVSGKGTPAALYMAVSTSALAAKVGLIPDGKQLYRELNAMLYPRMIVSRMNTALLYVRFTQQADCWTGRIVNAGLIAPLLRRNGACEYLEVGGLPLGVLSQTDYTELEVSLHDDDWLILCSDGIVEAMNEAREIYGFERLQERVTAFVGTEAQTLRDWIMSDVEAFAGGADQQDDMTVVVIRIASGLTEELTQLQKYAK